MGRKGKGILCVCVGVLLLSGCGAAEQSVVTIERTPYEKLSYETTEVKRGNLVPEISLKLEQEGYEKINYQATGKDLELDTVYVSVGDHVEKGDILVSFRSESVQEIIDTYEEQREQNQLLIDHYTRLMQIDTGLDYGGDIEALQNDIGIANLYIEEAQEKLSRYQIVAEKSGTITKMDAYLQNGVFMPDKQLITQVCGTGNYLTEKPEGYEFTPGDIYTAEAGINAYELKVSEVTENSVIFTPVSDMSAVAEGSTLQMTVKQPEVTDAVYVNANAVKEVDGAYYVYLLNENGYREAVSVTVGDCVGEYRIITDGLSGGEKVTLQ